MAKKFSFKSDERKIKKGEIAGYDQEGNEIREQSSFAETEEEHATRIAEAEERRSRGEYTDEERKEIDEAARAQEEREKYLEGSRDARAKLGLLTADEKKEDKAKQIAADRQARKERYEAGMAKVDEMIAKNKENEAARREAWHQINRDAQKTAMESKALTAKKDPGRYSPTERNAALDWLKQKESNRRFDEDNKTRLQESADKREGMINQGKGAAEENARATIGTAEARYGSWTYQDGKKVFVPGAEVAMEQMKKDAAEYLAKAEHGYTDADGVYHPGSAERVQESKNKGELEKTKQQGADNLAITKQQGADNLAAEQERSKSAQTQAQIKALTETAKSDEKIELLRIKSKSKLNEIQYKGLVTQISKELMGDPMTGRKAMTPDELRKKYKDNPDVLNILNGGVTAGGGGGTSDFEVK